VLFEKKKMKSELFKRVVFAIIGIPIALFLIIYGELPFLFAIIIISSVALYEFYSLAKLKNVNSNFALGFLFNLIFILFIYFSLSNAKILINSGFIILVLILLLVLSAFSLEMWRRKENRLLNVSTTISGILYACFPFYSLILIREFYKITEFFINNNINLPLFFINQQNLEEFSIFSVIFVLITIWICDSAAFFIGKNLGKHKLFERVSPKKTWEGAVAGFIASILSSFLLFYFFVPNFPYIHSIMLGVIIGIFGQIGDLAESLIKRDVGVKDSSNLIPGHGGALDRFDSILFVFPLVFVYFILLLVC